MLWFPVVLRDFQGIGAFSMPRMGKRPPSYGLHKSTGQAVVYRTGDKPLYLGKRCSPESHARYEQFLAERRAE